MATFDGVSTRAIRLLGDLSSGEIPSPQELLDAGDSLRSMLSVWSMRQWITPSVLTATNTLTAPQGTFNLLADLNLVPFTDLQTVAVKRADLNRIMPVLSRVDYLRAQRDYESWPNGYLFDADGSGGGEIKFPRRLSTGDTIIISYFARINASGSGTATIPLDERYTDAMIYNLHLRIASEYNVAPTIFNSAYANETLETIRELAQSRRMSSSPTDAALAALGNGSSRGRNRGNIYTGWQ